MNPITHGLVGWALAASLRSRRDRALVVVAALAPDLDGLGIGPEWLTATWDVPLDWYTRYHRMLLHNGLSCGLMAVAAAAVAKQRWRTAGLVFASAHLHLLGDVLGSRGPEGKVWSVPYFVPLHDTVIAWQGQWALDAWPNITLTVILLLWTFWFAWRRGRSPLGLVSIRADEVFVSTLRARFGNPSA
jgi:inner membrane protein